MLTAPGLNGQTQTYSATDVALQAQLDNYQVVRNNPVLQPVGGMSAPADTYNRGWVMPLFNRSFFTYVDAQAPEITYTPKSYANLIQQAANPPVVRNQIPLNLSAPMINTGY